MVIIWIVCKIHFTVRVRANLLNITLYIYLDLQENEAELTNLCLDIDNIEKLIVTLVDGKHSYFNATPEL